MDLDDVEQRVLGCLVEKASTTPQTYPLTINALRLACNQSTSRDPIVDYDERAIEAAVTSLRARGLTRIVYSPSNRGAKHRQVLGEGLGLRPEEVAVVAILLLRGDQTVGEIKGRTERLHPFASLAETQETLDRLAGRDEPLVVERERRAGQKDLRWSHLLGPAEPIGPERDSGPAPGADVEVIAADPGRGSTLATRLGLAEAAIADLTGQVDALRLALEALRPEVSGGSDRGEHAVDEVGRARF
ncbi:MAG: YceH family protein [Acidimicrobiales bacterium]